MESARGAAFVPRPTTPRPSGKNIQWERNKLEVKQKSASSSSSSFSSSSASFSKRWCNFGAKCMNFHCKWLHPSGRRSLCKCSRTINGCPKIHDMKLKRRNTGAAARSSSSGGGSKRSGGSGKPPQLPPFQQSDGEARPNGAARSVVRIIKETFSRTKSAPDANPSSSAPEIASSSYEEDMAFALALAEADQKEVKLPFAQYRVFSRPILFRSWMIWFVNSRCFLRPQRRSHRTGWWQNNAWQNSFWGTKDWRSSFSRRRFIAPSA